MTVFPFWLRTGKGIPDRKSFVFERSLDAADGCALSPIFSSEEHEQPPLLGRPMADSGEGLPLTIRALGKQAGRLPRPQLWWRGRRWRWGRKASGNNSKLSDFIWFSPICINNSEKIQAAVSFGEMSSMEGYLDKKSHGCFKAYQARYFKLSLQPGGRGEWKLMYYKELGEQQERGELLLKGSTVSKLSDTILVLETKAHESQNLFHTNYTGGVSMYYAYTLSLLSIHESYSFVIISNLPPLVHSDMRERKGGRKGVNSDRKATNSSSSPNKKSEDYKYENKQPAAQLLKHQPSKLSLVSLHRLIFLLLTAEESSLESFREAFFFILPYVTKVDSPFNAGILGDHQVTPPRWNNTHKEHTQTQETCPLWLNLKLQTVKSIEYWIKNHPEDANVKLKLQFSKALGENFPPAQWSEKGYDMAKLVAGITKIKGMLKERINTAQKQAKIAYVESPYRFRGRAKNYKGNISQEVTPEILAQQLTLNSFSRMARISPREIIFRDKEGILQDIIGSQEIINTHTVLQSVVQSEEAVDKEAALSKMAAAYSYFVRVAHHCLKLKSYNCVFEIMTGLGSLHLKRLKIRDRLPEKDQKIVDEIDKATNTAKNYEAYRKLIESDKKEGVPCIPFYTVQFYKKVQYIEDSAKLAGGFKQKIDKKTSDLEEAMMSSAKTPCKKQDDKKDVDVKKQQQQQQVGVVPSVSQNDTFSDGKITSVVRHPDSSNNDIEKTHHDDPQSQTNEEEAKRPAQQERKSISSTDNPGNTTTKTAQSNITTGSNKNKDGGGGDDDDDDDAEEAKKNTAEEVEVAGGDGGTNTTNNNNNNGDGEEKDVDAASKDDGTGKEKKGKKGSNDNKNNDGENDHKESSSPPPSESAATEQGVAVVESLRSTEQQDLGKNIISMSRPNIDNTPIPTIAKDDNDNDDGGGPAVADESKASGDLNNTNADRAESSIISTTTTTTGMHINTKPGAPGGEIVTPMETPAVVVNPSFKSNKDLYPSLPASCVTPNQTRTSLYTSHESSEAVDTARMMIISHADVKHIQVRFGYCMAMVNIIKNNLLEHVKTPYEIEKDEKVQENLKKSLMYGVMRDVKLQEVSEIIQPQVVTGYVKTRAMQRLRSIVTTSQNLAKNLNFTGRLSKFSRDEDGTKQQGG
eukprot:jgi/Bigna1/91506/estExt_fgenesh1_pg.C_1030029